MFSFYYNTIQSPEQVFLLFIYKILLIIYEHLCSNLQFISLPEEVGEFLLYIMLKRFPGDLLKLPMFYFFAVFLLLWIFFEKKNLKTLLSILLEIVLLTGVYFYLYYQGRYMVNRVGVLSEIICYGPFDRMPETLLDNIYWFGGWECRTLGYTQAMAENGIQNPYKDVIGNNKIYLADDNIDLTLKYIQEYYEPNAQAVFVKTVGNVNLYQIILH